MHSATIRPYLNAGVALVGAGVIAAAPVAAPAPPHVSLPTIRSAEVALTAAVNPLEAYGQLLNNTFQNIGLLTNQTFQNGIAPLLSQVLKNQQTMLQGLGKALQDSLQISNTNSIPAVLQRAVNQLANGQIQDAAETIATGVVQVAFPFLPPLLQPLNNFVAVVDTLPDVVRAAGLAVISPPLALVQATGQAIQDIADAFGTGDPRQIVSAVVDAPATMINGFLNGYAPTQTGGLLTPNLGSLSLLVNIRDMIVDAITPDAAGATKTAATDEVTATKTKAAKVVTLDVAPASTDKATDSSAAKDNAAADGQASDGKDAAAGDSTAATDAKDDTTGKTAASTPATDETGSSTEATDTKDTAATDGTDAKGDTTAKGDTGTKGDTATKADTGTKGDTASKGDASSTKGSDSDKGSASTAKGDSTTKKASDSKKDSGTAKSTHKKAATK